MEWAEALLINLELVSPGVPQYIGCGEKSTGSPAVENDCKTLLGSRATVRAAEPGKISRK